MSAATACTQLAVYVEHDSRASFSELGTYDWATRTAVAPADDPELDAGVRSAVEKTPAARALRSERIPGLGLADADRDTGRPRGFAFSVVDSRLSPGPGMLEGYRIPGSAQRLA